MKSDSLAYITPQLLARYDTPGPRYTSYPTALEFTDSVTVTEYHQHLARLGETNAPVSMYVHIPFCKSRCHFCGCHTALCKSTDELTAYTDYLVREIELLGKQIVGTKELAALHFGGGTPTFLPDSLLARLIDTIAITFPLRANAEVAIEVNPGVSSATQIRFLRSIGFNRVSFGVQDFHPEVLRAIGRNQARQQTEAVIDAAREAQFSSINLDLIYGLPFQTASRFEQTLADVLAIQPDRIALYSFAYIPWIRDHQNKLDASALPDRDAKFALFAMATKAFLQNGYQQIGMDHFALASDDLAKAVHTKTLYRNFMGYTVTRSKDILGVGVSSIGYVAGGYFQNEKDNSPYFVSISQNMLPVQKGLMLKEDDVIRAALITELMCHFEIRIPEFEQHWKIDFHDYFAAELLELETQRQAAHQGNELAFTELSEGALSLTAVGRLFVRNVCMVFDVYLKNKTESRPLFSRTV